MKVLRLSTILSIIALLCITVSKGFGQQPASAILHGQVKDSVTNTPLPQATIAVYIKKDSSLVKYQLNDAYGRFKMTNLPLNTTLLLVVSYVSYKSYRHTFTLTAEKPTLALNQIFLASAINSLEEVSITVPPVVMKGDTMVFNADAFKLKPTAVVGDLLRELPGVIMWGDGKITVNGKNVSALTVNGKTFFSGDASIITDNLPKGIVEKVEVIPVQMSNKTSESDTSNTVKMNVTLKKGKESGLFGKVGAGFGSDQRYDADLMLSFFSPKTQASVVGGANNVNKVPLDVNAAMLNSGYSSGTVNRNLSEPNFQRAGITSQKNTGFKIKQEWNPRTDSDAEVFHTSSDLIYNEVQNRTTLLADSSISRYSGRKGQTSGTSTNTSASTNYRPNADNWLNVVASYRTQSLQTDFADSAITSSSGVGLLNQNTGSTFETSTRENLKLGIGLDHKIADNKMGSKTNYSINYHFEQENNNQLSQRIDEFNPLYSSFGDTYFNRERDVRHQLTKNTVNLTYNSLNALLNLRTRTSIILKNSFYTSIDQRNVVVRDFDLLSDGYTDVNQYLTNRENFKEIQDVPSIHFGHRFSKSVSGRYFRSLTISASANGRFIRQKNESQKEFQRISRTYNKFTPTVSFNFLHRKPGIGESNLDIGFAEEVVTPSMNQLAPLIDSARQDMIWGGNLNLLESMKHVFEVNYSYSGYGANNIQIKSQTRVSFVDDFISSNSFYDENGRLFITPVNLSGYKDFNTLLLFAKPFKLKKHLLTTRFSPKIGLEYRPFLNNSILSNAIGRSVYLPISADYSLSSIFNMSVLFSRGNYVSEITAQNRKAKSFNNLLRLSGQITTPSELRIISSLNMNQNGGPGFHTKSFVIWNAYLSYRFNQQKTIELKLSATDILNQNKGVINYIGENTITTGSINRLQRYFLLSLAYFPRKFGF